MTKFILYIILVQPGMLVTMHTSFWSLASCNEARDQALDSHHDIQVAICVAEDNAADTWYGAEAERQERSVVFDAELETIE
jgi:hypothetical protein